ncbi:MAG: hypothetical protein U5N21_23560 [Rhodococcus sp. (in: high G+C Gram-positive bacteria)]|nr:hypothetical protein [Rhodococcus sp. (in: high G+C Gram-positive bacteria)]
MRDLRLGVLEGLPPVEELVLLAGQDGAAVGGEGLLPLGADCLCLLLQRREGALAEHRRRHDALLLPLGVALLLLGEAAALLVELDAAHRRRPE